MKSLEQWFEAYGESHRNHTNKITHWFCVPLVTFSVLGLLWAVHWSLAIAIMAVALFFYIRLSVPLTLAMLVSTGIMLFIISLLESALVPLSLGIFIIAWIFQFIGHHIEGKKPSFFQDVQFLLIGYLWVIAFLFRRLGIKY